MKYSLVFQWTMLVLFFIGMSAPVALTQTPDQQRAITAGYNISQLRQMENEYRSRQNEAKQKALEHARSRNLPVFLQLEGGGTGELQQVEDDGTLIYYVTNNVAAARSTRVNHLNTGGSTGYNLDGLNMTAHVWDGGHARITHQEYDGSGGTDRFSVGDLATPSLSSHSAHITGTIIASGVTASAKGMAPQARIKGYEWNCNLSEATGAAANGMLLSNHFYGWKSSGLPSYYFGTYMSDARDWDNLHFNAPYYLMVK